MTHFRFTVLCVIGAMMFSVGFMNPFSPVKMLIFMATASIIGFSMYPVGNKIKHRFPKV